MKRRLLPLFAIFLIAVLGLAACQQGASLFKVRTPVEKGRDALDSKDYAAAIRRFTRAIGKEPDRAELYYLRGTAYYDRYNTAFIAGDSSADPSDFEHALADFDRAISLNPNYAEAYNYRGLVHAAYKRYDEALADYNRAIDLDPRLATPYYARAYIYEVQGKIDEAIADYQHFLELNLDPYWEDEAQKRLDALLGN